LNKKHDIKLICWDFLLANLTKNDQKCGFLVEAWAEASVTSLKLMGVMTRCGRCSCLDHVLEPKKSRGSFVEAMARGAAFKGATVGAVHPPIAGQNHCNTVDGQNPAPPRMITIPLFIGF